jgi:hypothetical protein
MIRLARKPSLLASVLGRVAFLMICAVAIIAALYFVWKRRSFLIFALVDFIAIAAIVDLILFLRKFRHGAPIVEVDRESLFYGDSASVHIVEGHPKPIAELGVKLIGECYKESATDISSYREKKRMLTRCYEEELLRLKPSEAVDRTVPLQIPKSPPADGMNWSIVVDSHLKQGGVIEHSYPLPIRENT